MYGSIDAYRVYFRESSDSGSYSANRQDSGHDKTELTIDGLKPNTAYSIYVVGYTKLGISPRSNSIQVRTLPGMLPNVIIWKHSHSVVNDLETPQIQRTCIRSLLGNILKLAKNDCARLC